ncbi:hypothetical protein ACJ72_07843 [Emergomyces africanus]|uniref:Uncharacterized protein n=1 Tax=Emergomyces africanus TaxID=1955775 RepID=A0A1B7NM08_9EURO|nr:hypothetical protein ACJ72_07843 [Emergomyces africanus]
MQFTHLPVEIHFSIAAYLQVNDVCSLICTSQFFKGTLASELRRRATTHVFKGVGSPLHWAAKHDKAKPAQALIDMGLPISQKNRKGQTALHLAAHHGSVNAAKVLIDRGIDIASLDHYNEDAVSVAAKQHEAGILQLLIDAGGDISARNKVDVRGRTPLLSAVSAYEARATDASKAKLDNTIRTLLRGGADPMGTDHYHHTPLVLALDRNCFSAVCLLLGAGAHFPPGANLADILDSAMRWSNEPMVKILVAIGTDIEQMFTSAIHRAKAPVVRYLVRAYPASEMSDETKNCGLEAAVRRRDVELAEVLISAGAKATTMVMEENKPMTLFRLAMKNRSAQMVKLLLDSGAKREIHIRGERSRRISSNPDRG